MSGSANCTSLLSIDTMCLLVFVVSLLWALHRKGLGYNIGNAQSNEEKVTSSEAIWSDVNRVSVLLTTSVFVVAVGACNGRQSAQSGPPDAGVSVSLGGAKCSDWSDGYFSIALTESEKSSFHASDTISDYLKALGDPSLRARLEDLSYSYRLVAYAQDMPIQIVRIERRESRWYKLLGQEVWSRASRPGELQWFEQELTVADVAELHRRYEKNGMMARNKWEKGGVDGTRYTFEVVGLGFCGLVSWSSSNTPKDDPRNLMASEMLNRL